MSEIIVHVGLDVHKESIDVALAPQMKGLPKVKAVFSLTVFAYNLKRAIKVLGTEKLILAVT